MRPIIRSTPLIKRSVPMLPASVCQNKSSSRAPSSKKSKTVVLASSYEMADNEPPITVKEEETLWEFTVQAFIDAGKLITPGLVTPVVSETYYTARTLGL